MTSFEKTEFKMTLIKALSVLVSACIMSITIGRYLGNWEQWRKEIEKRIGDMEKRQGKNERIRQRTFTETQE